MPAGNHQHMSDALLQTAWSRPTGPEGFEAEHFDFTATESWKSLFEIGIRAYYLAEWETGRWACEQFLSQDDVPSDVRERARRNQVYYAQHIAELVPGTVMQPIVFSVPSGRSRFNPSIDVNGNGYRMIVRSTNHVVRGVRYSILGGGSTIQTDNYLLDLDSDLKIQRVICLEEQLDGVTPVGPVGPFGQGGPVGPDDPLAQVGPVEPDDPLAPVGPVGPGIPCPEDPPEPVEPVGPVGPAEPAGPEMIA